MNVGTGSLKYMSMQLNKWFSKTCSTVQRGHLSIIEGQYNKNLWYFQHSIITLKVGGVLSLFSILLWYKGECKAVLAEAI